MDYSRKRSMNEKLTEVMRLDTFIILLDVISIIFCSFMFIRLIFRGDKSAKRIAETIPPERSYKWSIVIKINLIGAISFFILSLILIFFEITIVPILLSLSLMSVGMYHHSKLVMKYIGLSKKKSLKF